MKIQYTGMYDETVVPDFINPETGNPYTITRGESVDIPDDIAEGLLIQRANWRPAAGGKLRDFADIAADVRALEAKEAAGDDEAEAIAAAPADTGGTNPEG